jgi:hypothetical protein
VTHVLVPHWTLKIVIVLDSNPHSECVSGSRWPSNADPMGIRIPNTVCDGDFFWLDNLHGDVFIEFTFCIWILYLSASSASPSTSMVNISNNLLLQYRYSFFKWMPFLSVRRTRYLSGLAALLNSSSLSTHYRYLLQHRHKPRTL